MIYNLNIPLIPSSLLNQTSSLNHRAENVIGVLIFSFLPRMVQNQSLQIKSYEINFLHAWICQDTSDQFFTESPTLKALWCLYIHPASSWVGNFHFRDNYPQESNAYTSVYASEDLCIYMSACVCVHVWLYTF